MAVLRFFHRTMNTPPLLSTLTAAVLALVVAVEPVPASGASGAPTGPRPTVQVKATVDQVIDLLGDGAYAGRKDERRRKIVDAIGSRFNFALMSRLALGKTWKELGEDERRRFVDLFSKLLENTYIKRIESYSGEQIVFTKEKVKKNLAMVYSLFKKNNDEYSIIYKLRNENGDWLIYDVVIEGASIVKQYRRQFSRIIADENFDGLIARLDEKVKLLSQKL